MDTDTRRRLLTTGEWRAWVIAEARTWKYTPYQHKGRVKGVGADCGGMIYECYNPIFGPFKPFPKDYPPDWSLHKENEIYLEFIAPYVMEVPRPVPGGLAMFQVGRNYGHGTICTEKGTFVHAWGRNQAGSVTESGLNFFTIGNGGRPRRVQYYDVDQEWLSSHQ